MVYDRYYTCLRHAPHEGFQQEAGQPRLRDRLALGPLQFLPSAQEPEWADPAGVAGIYDGFMKTEDIVKLVR